MECAKKLECRRILQGRILSGGVLPDQSDFTGGITLFQKTAVSVHMGF